MMRTSPLYDILMEQVTKSKAALTVLRNMMRNVVIVKGIACQSEQEKTSNTPAI